VAWTDGVRRRGMLGTMADSPLSTTSYRRACASGLLVLLAGCAVGPDYERPETLQAEMPEAWHAPLPHGGTIDTLARWWQQFDDPVLTGLIEQAENDSPDLDTALGAIRESRAALATARSRYLPGVAANGSATRNGTHSSGDAASFSGPDTTYTLYSGSLDASWELDLFGGARRNAEAQRARADAALAGWHDARVSLAAEVADAYVSLRHCERLVALYADTLASQRETERLTGLKLDAGFVAPADAAQARAAAYDAENRLLAQQGSCEQQFNRLVRLTGLSAGALQPRLAAPAPAPLPDGTDAQDAAVWQAGIPVPLQPAAPSIPAALLDQRPDLVAAERRLVAASAEIGVATASRLPSLTLVGNIGINHVDGVDGSTRSWLAGPSLSLPIFEGGAGLAREEAARARFDQAFGAYRSAVRLAVEDVENALTRVDSATRRVEAARLAERNYSDLLASEENRYRLGATSLIDLEVSRRLTLGARENLAAVQLEISQAWIALYKAVGGGWDDRPDDTADTAATPAPAPDGAGA